MAYGGLKALSGVHLTVERGEIVGLIGPNGAGKTTLFNLLTGVYTPTGGNALFGREEEKKSLCGRRPCRICSDGIARTFQNIRLFKDMTVLDNLRIAMHRQVPYGFVVSLLRTPSFSKAESDLEKSCMALLERLGLSHRRFDLAKNLSYGEQRRLEIARALATAPALLLLDEPAAGMNPSETAQLASLIADIKKDFNLAILLIEHDMSLVMRICERIYVLNHGEIIAEGTPIAIQRNTRVIEAYLGVAE